MNGHGGPLGKKDPEFREQLEAWQHGPQRDLVTVAPSRRIIIEGHARRVLHERQNRSIRNLLNIHDRLTGEITSTTEQNDENRSGPSDGIELTPEQVERIWAERERQRQRPEEDASAQPDQP